MNIHMKNWGVKKRKRVKLPCSTEEKEITLNLVYNIWRFEKLKGFKKIEILLMNIIRMKT